MRHSYYLLLMRRNFLLFLILIVPSLSSAQPIPKLFYVYDALCGWCYGFSPVMERFAKDYEGRVEIDVISGGLRYDENAGQLSEIAPFIKSAYKTVERTCGVKFGDAFVKGSLERGDIRLNSLPPAIALSIVRERKPESVLPFAAALHRMIYVDGHVPEDISRYATYASYLGVDTIGFAEAMKESRFEQQARADFKRAADMGISGFPAVIIRHNGKDIRLTNGYVSFDELKSTVDNYLK